MTERLRPWRVIASRTIHVDPPHIELTVDDIELPDGRKIEGYYQLSSRASCAVVATTTDGRFIMLRQYKHGARKVCLTVPGGRLEQGETLDHTARRELLEETGYCAPRWASMGEFAIHANQHMGVCGVFRAHDAVYAAPPASGDLEEMEVVLLTADETRAALRSGDIATLGDAAAIGLALMPPHES